MSLNVKVRALKYHRFGGEMRSPGDVYSVNEQDLAKKLVEKGNSEFVEPEKKEKAVESK